ncbi:MAG TPA: hypothetical protein PLB41_09840, partial [Rubrivivax sp.]|nr:hypothetical protein [Rubrivivax sp.]
RQRQCNADALALAALARHAARHSRRGCRHACTTPAARAAPAQRGARVPAWRAAAVVMRMGAVVGSVAGGQGWRFWGIAGARRSRGASAPQGAAGTMAA